MTEKRKDNKGRNLRTGEYYDEKNKRYMFRKMVNGERVTITSPDLADLRRQENELLCRIDKGSKPKSGSSKVLLNEYFEYWMETYAKTGRKATTCTNYKSYYNTYINNTIGKKKITKITKADCQKIINEMTESGKKHSTMSNLKSCLNNIFECAVDDEMILKNPAKNIQIPRTERKKREAIEQNQIELFMRYVKTNGRYQYAYPAFVALFNLGVRIGDADGKISLNQQKPSKHAGLRRFGPEKFLQRNNEFMKERPIFYKKPIKTEKDFSTWLRCFYYTTKAVITEYIYF